MTPTTIQSTKARKLSGTFHTPDATAERAIVIHPATGVPAAFYTAFAAWVAETHRALVLTYDYRDFAASAAGPVARSDATMSDWGIDDQSAALDHLIAALPDVPVWTIGHSLGGFMLPFHAQANRVERHFAIASGPAHWTRHPASFIVQAVSFWWLVGPAATLALGYLPGKALGMGADLPGPAYWQWRRWCTSSEFYRSDFGAVFEPPDLDRIDARVDLVGIADDVMIPPRVVAGLADFFPEGTSRYRTVDPRDHGLSRVGHIHPFHARNAALWPALISA
ncbi:MAG: alpha/beta hydrolase [Pseudomonadota bacterium]